MSDKVLVSVIVPFFKVEKYFERCLESIVSQTLKDIEIILIDDCGGDRSIEIAKRFAQKDDRIKIINNDKNRGQGYSRNVGIRLAQGEYIAFVDSDDWIEQDMYKSLYEKAKKNNTDILKCNFRFVWKDRTFVYNLSNICKSFNKKHTVYDNPEGFLGELLTSVWNGIYKKEFLLKCGITFNENIKFEDIIFSWQTLIQAKCIMFMPNILYNYFQSNKHSDINSIKFLNYFTINAGLLGKIAKTDKSFTNAYIIYCFKHLNFVISKRSIFVRKKIFDEYYGFIKDFDKTNVDEIVSKGFISAKAKSFVNGNYDEFIKNESFLYNFVKRIKRSIIYYAQ